MLRVEQNLSYIVYLLGLFLCIWVPMPYVNGFYMSLRPICTMLKCVICLTLACRRLVLDLFIDGMMGSTGAVHL